MSTADKNKQRRSTHAKRKANVARKQKAKQGMNYMERLELMRTSKPKFKPSFNLGTF